MLDRETTAGHSWLLFIILRSAMTGRLGRLHFPRAHLFKKPLDELNLTQKSRKGDEYIPAL